MNQILAYGLYLLIAIFLIVVVGFKFYHYGEVYILKLFPKNELLAMQMNKLLLIGYYLLNIGFVLNTFQSQATIATTLDMLNFLSKHLSQSILIIAIVHYLNLFWIYFLSHNHNFKTKYLQS